MFFDKSASMDSDCYDSIQLISVTEVFEEFYKMTKVMFENAATLNKDKKNFDSFLCPDDELTKTEFLNKTHLPPVSVALMELIVTMEWCIDKKQPTQTCRDVNGAILRLESVLKNSSDWEIVCTEEDELHSGPANIISEYELYLMDKTIPPYVTLIMNEDKEGTMFFPLTNEPKEGVMEKWRILEKLATVRITSQKTTYKEKLSQCLKEKLQIEVSNWIERELKKIKGAGKNTVLKDMQSMTNSLQDLTDHVVVAADVIGSDGRLFTASQCSYFDAVAETLESKLYPWLKQIMEHLDSYHVSHKNFHVNLRESSVLCHSFYLALKNLVRHVVEQVKSQSSLGKMKNFSGLFGDAFLHLLHVLKSECHFRISRAVASQDDFNEEEKILNSVVLALNCLCTVLDEWRKLEMEDEEMCIAFLVKITDTICDGAKIFAEALDERVGNMSIQTKDTKCVQKICIVANSVDHVRAYLLPLPEMMRWGEILPAALESEESPSLREQILELLTHIHESMDNHMQSTVNRIVQILVLNLRSSSEKFLNPWVYNTMSSQNVNKLLSSLDDHLSAIHNVMREQIFNQLLCSLWVSFLSYIKDKFQEGQRADYARNIKQNIEELHGYFLHLEMKENGDSRQILQEILALLDLNSKSTVELQLDYYGQLADLLISPLEYLGHLAFQAGYKKSERGTIDILVKVQKGQKIPVRKFDIDELTVTVELCPSSIFPSQHPFKTQPVLEQLDNPVFNQTFEFVQLHSSVLSIKGAVIQLRVQNQDCSFCGEAVVNLNLVQNMSNVASMDFLPVYLMSLRMFDRVQPSFQVLESRSKWDRRAKSFVIKRLKVTKSRRVFPSCIPKRSYSMCGVFGNN